MAKRKREVVFDPGRMDAVASGDVVVPHDVLLTRVRYLVGIAVDGLPLRYRDVLEGVYWRGATYDELASEMGFGHRSSVLRLKRDAEAMLRARLEGTECEILWNICCKAKGRTTDPQSPC